MGIKLDSFDNRVFIDEMVSAGDRIVCDREQTIYTAGAPAQNLYLLEQGLIDCSEHGVVRFSLTIPGELFGWACFREDRVHRATAVSKTISSVIQIPVASAIHTLDRHKETAEELHRRLEHHFSGIL